MMRAISAALIDAGVNEYVDAGLFSGVVLVSQGDRVVYQVPNSTTTKFHIASVSKPITAGNSFPISRMAIASHRRSTDAALLGARRRELDPRIQRLVSLSADAAL